jgi:glycosyltransferase involved in cell wall biosynthesis
MRVAIDCRKIVDYGIGTYIRGLLAAFAAEDDDTQFVLFVPHHCTSAVPECERFTIVQEDSPNYSVRELFAIQRQIDRARVDLFHAPHYVTPLTTIPMVVTVHDLIHLLFPEATSSLLAPFYAQWMIGRSVDRARAVLVPSNTVRTSILDRFPGAKDKIVVSANGVDAEFFDEVDAELRDGVLDACGLVQGGYFLYVGNDKPHKNLELLFEAYLEAADSFPHLSLALVGREFAGVPDLPHIVKTGYVTRDELRALYHGAFALVMPSLYEGFGLPAVEAMASGTPVIASTGGALPEVVGDAALQFDPSSRTLLIDAMTRLATDDELRRTLVERGHRRARSFAWRATARTTLETYRRALSRA